MAINLGSAAFRLALESGGFVSSMTGAASSLAGFAQKTTAGMSKSTQAFQKFSLESGKIDAQMEKQKGTVAGLTAEYDRYSKQMVESSSSLSAQEQLVNDATAAINKQKEALQKLQDNKTKWKQQRVQELRAKGADLPTARTGAKDQFDLLEENAKNKIKAAQIAFDLVANTKAKIKAENMQIESQMSQYATRVDLETQKLKSYEAERAKLGAGPGVPSGLAVGAARVNEVASGIVSGVGKANEAINNSLKGFERYTRGIRGVTPEYKRLQENVYNAEQAIKSQTARIEQAKQALGRFEVERQSAAAQEVHRNQQIAAAQANEQKKMAEIAYEQDKLNKMQGQASPAAITFQMTKITALTAELNRHQATIKEQLVFQQRDLQLKGEIAQKEEVARQFLAKLTEAQTKGNLALSSAKTKLSEYVTKQKEKVSAEKESASAIANLNQKIDENGNKVSWLSGLWGKLFGSSRSFSTEMKTAASGADHLNTSVSNLDKPLSNLHMFFANMIGSGIGSFFGTLTANLSNVAGQALEVNKNNELMQLSLKNMINADLVNNQGMSESAETMAIATEKAKGLSTWMQKLAIESPFSKNDIRDGMQLGLSLGFNTDQMKRLTTATVNWASANGKSGDEITQVIRAVGQMNANGKVTLEDLNQLTNVGIGWTSVLEKEFAPEMKKTGMGLRDLISAGIVPADRAIGALTGSFETSFKTGAADAGQSITGLLASLGDIKEGVLSAAFDGLFAALKPLLVAFTNFFLNSGVVDQIREFGVQIGENVTAAITAFQGMLPQLMSYWTDFTTLLTEGMSFISGLANQAYEWGSGLVEQYGQGISDAASGVIEFVQELASMISEWLMPQSPPKILPDIDKWGKATIEIWRDGMLQGDMSKLSDIGNTVQSILTASSGGDEKNKAGIAGRVLGTQEAMAVAINEFKKTGKVSEEAFKSINGAAGAAGAKVEQYARAMFESEAATAKVSKAQQHLNDVTTKYDRMLAPLNEKLAAAQKKSEQIKLGKEIASLQDMLNFKNPEGMGFDMSEVQARIEELQAQQQISNVEAERGTAIDAAQKNLDIAQQEQQQKDDNLTLVKSQIDFDQQHNQLLLDQTTIIEKKISSMKEMKNAVVDAALEEKKLSDAQFETAFQAANAADRVQMLQDRLAQSKPGTVEYEKLQQRLQKATADYNKELEQQAKNTEKLSDAEFEAALASMTREEKIDALTKRMAEMEPGSLKQLEIQKKINALQLAQDTAEEKKLGGGKKKKDKGGMLTDKPFAGLGDDAKETQKSLKEVGKNIGDVSKTIGGYSDAIRGFFAKLKDYSGIIGYIIERLAAGFVFFIAINKVIKPFLSFVLGLGKLLTPVNLLMLAIIGIGIVIREDIGGIQGVIARAWEKMKPIFDDIKYWIDVIALTFKIGDIQTGIKAIGIAIPEIFKDIGKIFVIVGNSFKEWVTPFLDVAVPIVKDMFTRLLGDIQDWFMEGGFQGVLQHMVDAIMSGKDGAGKAMITGALAFLTGGFTLIYGIISDQIVKNTPGLIDKFIAWKDAAVSWILDVFPRVMSGFGIIIGGVLAGLAKGILSAIPKLVPMVLEFLNIVLSFLPALIKGLTSIVTTFLVWLATDGIVTIVRGLGQITISIANWLAKSGPNFAFQVANLLGDTLMKLIMGIVAINAYWFSQIIPLLGELVKWIGNDLFPTIVNIFKNAAATMPALILGFLTGLLQPIIDTASLFVSDLVQNALASFGVALDKNKADTVKKWIDLWDSIVNGIKAFLGISSPSTVFLQIAIDAVQGAIDGAVQMAEALYDSFLSTWNKIKDDSVKSVNESLDTIEKRWTEFQKTINKVVTDLKTNITTRIREGVDAVVRLWQDMQVRSTTAINLARDNAVIAFNSIYNNATTTFGNIYTAISDKIDDIVDKVNGGIDKLKRFFSDPNMINNLRNAAVDLGKAIVNGIIDGFNGAIDFLKNSLVSFLQDTVRKILSDWTADFMGNHPASSGSSSGTTDNTTGTTGKVGKESMMGGKSMMGTMSMVPTEGTWTGLSRRYFAPSTFSSMQGYASKAASGARMTRTDWASIAKTPGIDLLTLHKWLEYMITEAREGLSSGGVASINPSGMTTNSVNDNSNVTNNFNATFATPKASNGLMNDFTNMRSLRRV